MLKIPLYFAQKLIWASKSAAASGFGRAKESLVRYQVSKTNGGPSYHEWPAAEFVGRAAGLCEQMAIVFWSHPWYTPMEL